MNAKPYLKLAPERRLIMNLALRQSLDILQMPQQELADWLEKEVEKNPFLEWLPSASKKRVEIDLPFRPSFSDHIKEQIRESFCSLEEQQLAERALNFLDERGFLPEEVSLPASILVTLQTFDPPGVFARNLQESLLIQLRAKGKSHTLAFLIVEQCFDDLLHGRYSAIKKALQTDFGIGAAISELSRLCLRPTSTFEHFPISLVTPDLHLGRIEGGWTLQLTEDDLPQVYMQEEYLSLHPDTKEEKEVLSGFKAQAKLLFRALEQRRRLLREIGRRILAKQSAYLEQKGPLVSLTLTDLAEELEIHESTLSRAISGKYIATPRGILPLRSFFTTVPQAQTAQEILALLVRSEDKKRPFTDDELSKELKVKGIALARRTIAKYRRQLKIGSAVQRKNSH